MSCRSSNADDVSSSTSLPRPYFTRSVKRHDDRTPERTRTSSIYHKLSERISGKKSKKPQTLPKMQWAQSPAPAPGTSTQSEQDVNDTFAVRTVATSLTHSTPQPTRETTSNVMGQPSDASTSIRATERTTASLATDTQSLIKTTGTNHNEVSDKDEPHQPSCVADLNCSKANTPSGNEANEEISPSDIEAFNTLPYDLKQSAARLRFKVALLEE